MKTAKILNSIDNFNKPFPTILRKKLDDLKMTQETLAQAVGVKRQTISQWQNGTTSPDIDSLIRIAEYFGVSCDFLLGISKAESRDDDIQSIHEKTDLSDKVIKDLIEEKIKARKKSDGSESWVTFKAKLINKIMNSDTFLRLMFNVDDFKLYTADKFVYEKYKKHYNENYGFTGEIRESLMEKISSLGYHLVDPVMYCDLYEGVLQREFINFVKEYNGEMTEDDIDYSLERLSVDKDDWKSYVYYGKDVK